MKIGLIKSALDLFEEIDAWHEIIECCISLGRKSRAVDIIRARITASSRTPRLLALLGDVTNEPQHWQESWDISVKQQKPYPRAQRALAKYRLDRKEYAEAIKHYALALEINPVIPTEWFAMGFASMECSDLQSAVTAFTRVVGLDPEYGEAWNNLAAAHMQLKNKREAFGALEQAIKFKYDSWKLWENFLLSAMDVGEFQKAMMAMEKVVQLKPPVPEYHHATLEERKKHGGLVHIQAFGVLCDVALDQMAEKKDDFLTKRFERLISAIDSKVTDNQGVYAICSRFYHGLGDDVKSIDYKEKQCRAMQGSNWLEDPESFAATANAICELTQMYLSNTDPKHIFSAKLLLETTLAKAQKSDKVKDSPGIAQLAAMLKLVKEKNATRTEPLEDDDVWK